ncbi:hypothetical protein [uncultured Umboniibacter sp.]|uniref:hypothetical protein n=1 Tax=uncultured Umboniibacter sp. TaxID=1798917 RepID=UPI00261BE1B3|nr:hypothetical protein [uncultured Umboniibacter sp.]
MTLAWFKGIFSKAHQAQTKVVVLHCGFHKTATTSFQMTCRKNRRALASQSWHYPIFGFKGEKFANHSVPIYSAFCNNPLEYYKNVTAGYSQAEIEQFNQQTREHLTRILKGNSRILLSGEGVSILSKDELEALKAYLTRFGHQLKVVCGVRSPYSSTCSAFQQQVKSGRRSSFSDGRVPRKSMLMTTLLAVFDDDVSFFSFDNDCRHSEGPVSSLFARIGISAESFNIVRINDGLSNLSTRVIAAINSSLKDDDPLRRSKFRRKLSQTNIGGVKFQLTKEEYNRTERALKTESDFMASQYKHLTFDNSVHFAEPVVVDLPTAITLIGTYSNPQIFGDVVLDFCLAHSDGTWSKTQLRKGLVSQSPEHKQIAASLNSQGLLD